MGRPFEGDVDGAVIKKVLYCSIRSTQARLYLFVSLEISAMDILHKQ